ncbi:hypothetical protein SAMN04488109_1623 [Chryseolinea serpens]|uniref:Por secretion system C-terminal sorting domain-containing protein n=1 Tax=Chryseolinea serpens TaxID=947013 RepID=A0A1M5MA63_9BACT|nr:hypothetical protein [Chryseolinea serpens]SHG73779.1 hypothetical protein SAMN04488109_1623 [Chryseolinea serpens]
MKTRLLLATFALLFAAHCFGQTSWDDQNRYWYYRYRLVDEFLIRGEESPLNCDVASGYSLPAGKTWTTNQVNGQNIDMDWGDATSYLGWYIGVLATEYKLLTDNNQSTEATKRELYYAMKAYERLDTKAEHMFYPHTSADCAPTNLNGLFVRDDVSEQLILQNRPDLVTRFSGDGNFRMHSDYHKFYEAFTEVNDINSNIYPTQDQISDLFMGFALVNKCVGNVTYQGYNFGQHAVNYTDLIANRLNVNFWMGKLPNGLTYKDGNFITELNAYGIAKAAQWITGQDYTQNLDAFSRDRWETLCDPLVGPEIMDQTYWNSQKDYTTALQMTYAAIGHSWEYAIAPEEHDVDVLGVTVAIEYHYHISIPGLQMSLPTIVLHPWDPAPPSITMNVTSKFLTLYGNDLNQQIYPLLHEYLNGDGTELSNAYFTTIIQGAPCEGPQHKPSNNINALGVNGWRGDSRWERPLSADGLVDIDNNAETGGKFNGLDYLLMYNLYMLTRGGGDTSYKNALNTVSSVNITSPGKYWSYETLETSGIIANNANTAVTPVEISANKTISLKPGFKVESGAKARIYITQNTACNTSLSGGTLREVVRNEEKQSPAEVKEKVLNGLATEIQAQYDSIAQLYSQYTLDSATLLREATEALNNAAEQVSVYPNPTTGNYSVHVTLKEGQKVQVALSDLYTNERKVVFDDYLDGGSNQLSFSLADADAKVLMIEIKCAEFTVVRRLVKKEK